MQSKIIGSAPALVDTLKQASLLAPVERPVLIIGERGSGKESIAERLHFLSRRWENPLMKVNCAAISEDLIDSELFGHESGAFTGARGRRQGRFELADNGTLFLDEVGTLPLRVQEKLLRAIEYGEIQRLGSETSLKVSVRVITATNADLHTMAANGQFRADLLDRLAFAVLTVPPLRERQEDVLELAEHFAVLMSQELNLSHFPGFSAHARRTLLEHSWPGNVRELKNAVERAVLYSTQLSDGGDEPLEINDIDLDPFRNARKLHLQQQHHLSTPQETQTSHQTSPQAASNLPDNAAENYEEQVEQFELGLIRNALLINKQKQTAAAKSLGISYDKFRALYRKFRDQL